MMADKDEKSTETLANNNNRRSVSLLYNVSLQRENEDLRNATSQNENIIMELSLSGKIQFLSKGWEDIVG